MSVRWPTCDAFALRSLTIPEALTHLRALREQLNDAMSRLHQELHSQRQTAEQLRDNKVCLKLRVL